MAVTSIQSTGPVYAIIFCGTNSNGCSLYRNVQCFPNKYTNESPTGSHFISLRIFFLAPIFGHIHDWVKISQWLTELIFSFKSKCCPNKMSLIKPWKWHLTQAVQTYLSCQLTLISIFLINLWRKREMCSQQKWMAVLLWLVLKLLGLLVGCMCQRGKQHTFFPFAVAFCKGVL